MCIFRHRFRVKINLKSFKELSKMFKFEHLSDINDAVSVRNRRIGKVENHYCAIGDAEDYSQRFTP